MMLLDQANRLLLLIKHLANLSNTNIYIVCDVIQIWIFFNLLTDNELLSHHRVSSICVCFKESPRKSK